MSNLIALQNAYGASARVMTTIQQMMATLLQIGT
jgi:flagellar hook-associated protein FlgK